VRVRLDYTAESLTVAITDDGPKPGRAEPGYGIVGMRERAQACGGTLHIGPADGGRGFTVTATLPAPVGC
jgi:signal transduction histidine kinase